MALVVSLVGRLIRVLTRIGGVLYKLRSPNHMIKCTYVYNPIRLRNNVRIGNKTTSNYPFTWLPFILEIEEVTKAEATVWVLSWDIGAW